MDLARKGVFEEYSRQFVSVQLNS